MLTIRTTDQVLETLRHLDEIKQQSIRFQQVLIEYLIHKHGGLRKAALACNESPSNFVNLRKGRRKASLELLAKYLKASDADQPRKD